MDAIRKAINVIQYTKMTKNSYAGPRFESGYHSFVLGGKSYRGTRDNNSRISRISNFDFSGKNVLDIGCNMGGVLHSICSKIHYGVGVDFDPKCINAANIVRNVNGVHNLDFYVFNLDTEDLNFISNFLVVEKIDICLFLSVAQHIKKWQEVIQFCYDTSDWFLFESNGKWHFQDVQKKFVESLYKDIKHIFNDGRRQMFLCHK